MTGMNRAVRPDVNSVITCARTAAGRSVPAGQASVPDSGPVSDQADSVPAAHAAVARAAAVADVAEAVAAMSAQQSSRCSPSGRCTATR